MPKDAKNNYFFVYDEKSTNQTNIQQKTSGDIQHKYFSPLFLSGKMLSVGPMAYDLCAATQIHLN